MNTMTLRELLDKATPRPWMGEMRDKDEFIVRANFDASRLTADLVNNAEAFIELWEAAQVHVERRELIGPLRNAVEALRPLMEGETSCTGEK